MIEIDGSEKSGSGTILRMSVALAAIRMQPLHIFNIRENRPQRGLKPQHLEAVLTAAKLCNARLEGAVLNSRELWFIPTSMEGGNIVAEIGTAGSIPMLLLTILPICAVSEKPIHLRVQRGGTDVRNSPTTNFIRFVLLRILERMGFHSSLTIHKYGYYPKGMGEITIDTKPCQKLEPLRLENFGKIGIVEGISVCTFLSDRKVAERQKIAAQNYFREKNLDARIQVINDTSNVLQKGSSITLWVETDTGITLGADAIGEIKKSSETVGIEAAEELWAEIQSRSTIDIHLADMIIPYLAISEGKSTFLTRKISEHLETNVWLAEKILDTHFDISRKGDLCRIEKLD